MDSDDPIQDPITHMAWREGLTSFKVVAASDRASFENSFTPS